MTIKQILTDSRGMLADRKGATAIEYGLIAAGIAVRRRRGMLNARRSIWDLHRNLTG